MLTPRFTLTQGRRAMLALPAALAATVGLALAPTAAHASTRQITIIQDQSQLAANPAGTMAKMQALGATTVRVFAIWSQIAPSPMATRKPNFNATNPNAYPAANWGFLDELDRLAKQDGMTIDLVVTGGQPRWAMGSGAPSQWVYTKGNPTAQYWAWKPNVGEFGQFVTAVGRRYDGRFTPSGQTSALPRIHFWSLYNEPNFGQDLGPQATDTSRISYAPLMYRNIVRASWSALSATGHGRDTILIGELAAHGYALTNGYHSKHLPQGLPGNGAQTEPLPFLRTLYCVNGSSKPLTGRAASNVGCPTNAAGRRSFRKDNPGLFDASGVGDHPYANTATPASDGKGNPQWSTLPNYGRMEAVLDGANRAWGSRARLSIYTDEYGYITNPPVKIAHYVSPTTAAKYINWGEYLMWRNPRVASYEQYLIVDAPPYKRDPGFASGLEFSNGKAKPSYAAFEVPLWLPNDVLRRPGTELVWGEARGAGAMARLTHRRQTVLVQFQAHGRGAWKTIDTVHSNSYFTVRPRFSTSGEVRLSYTYPTSSLVPMLATGFSGRTVVSRTQAVTVR